MDICHCKDILTAVTTSREVRVPPEFIFTNLERLTLFNSLANLPTPNLDTRPTHTPLDTAEQTTELFELRANNYRQIFYPITEDRAVTERLKTEILSLIQVWNPSDLKKTHRNASKPTGSVLLFAAGDPVCLITHLELDHPHIFVVATDALTFDAHEETILSLLPIISGHQSSVRLIE